MLTFMPVSLHQDWMEYDFAHCRQCSDRSWDREYDQIILVCYVLKAQELEKLGDKM